MTPIEKFGRFLESAKVQKFITLLIVVNAATFGLETVPRIMSAYGPLLHAVDKAILAVFVVEVGGKLAYRRRDFFRDGWNWFDFIVVGIALIPATGPLAILRTLRVFRVLRLLSKVPSMRKVVEALFRALPGMGSIAALIALIFYVGAVLATNLFGAKFAEWFGSVGASMYTLFQIMTLESWSMGIVRPVMAVHPLAWTFFVPFILITTFAVLNLYVGIVVDAMQSQHQAEQAQESAQAHGERTAILAEVEAMRGHMKEIQSEMSELRRLLEAARKD